MGLKRKLFMTSLVLMLIAILPGLPPKTVFPFRPITIAPVRPLTGVLAPNQLLNGAERLHEGGLLQPESVIVRGNVTYVSVYGGKILELGDQGSVRTVAKLGPECVGTYSERICGRPLGIDFDTKGNNLIVADPYLGIWQVHIKTGEKKLLVPKANAIIEDGTGKSAPRSITTRQPNIPNGVAVARNGDFYWSDTASDFIFEDAIQALLCNPSGRLLHYSRVEGKSRVLIDEVYGANGVALSPDESFVLVGELGGQLIRRYYLKGPKAGTHDVFIDGLPGAVDNLNGDAHGFWVGLVIAADDSNPSFIAMLAPFPNLRRLLVRLFVLVEAPFRLWYGATGSDIALWVTHHVGHLGGLVALFPDRGTVLRMDWEGNIVLALHNDDTSSHVISQAVPIGTEHLLLGSPVNQWLGRVKLTPDTLATLKRQPAPAGPTSAKPASTGAPPKEEL
ncbi:adipocyte plasma membrane-associated protein Hemomucin-like [Anopheles marshallii]|uniref:adipocyte plasma membrane-associated protein Hemomucin-like n=1 Tax=Anopheles marshallii TaxID=1521116 RepID=UPI00237BAAE4|nr:adipocyte plasma membrane-associated protein Hemomucin-like [Anopheles marshallii]